MFNKKSSLLSTLESDINTSEVLAIKTVVYQDMIWSPYVECRVFCDNNTMYACMFKDDEKVTPFVFCPNIKEGK